MPILVSIGQNLVGVGRNCPLFAQIWPTLANFWRYLAKHTHNTLPGGFPGVFFDNLLSLFGALVWRQARRRVSTPGDMWSVVLMGISRTHHPLQPIRVVSSSSKTHALTDRDGRMHQVRVVGGVIMDLVLDWVCPCTLRGSRDVPEEGCVVDVGKRFRRRRSGARFFAPVGASFSIVRQPSYRLMRDSLCACLEPRGVGRPHLLVPTLGS